MLLPYWRHCLDMLGLVFLGENLDSSLGWSDPLTAALKRCSLTEGIAVKENLVVYVVPSDGWCRYDQDVVCQSWIYSLCGLFSSPIHSFGLVWLWFFWCVFCGVWWCWLYASSLCRSQVWTHCVCILFILHLEPIKLSHQDPGVILWCTCLPADAQFPWLTKIRKKNRLPCTICYGHAK